MDEGKFRDEENDAMLLRYLHRDREVVRRLWGKENIDAFFWKTGSAVWWSISTTCSWEGVIVRYEFNMEAHTIPYLSSCGSPDGKGEQLSRVLVAIQLQNRKRSSMTLDRLADRPRDAIQLYCTLQVKVTKAFGALVRDASFKHLQRRP